ncbi:Arm DNA-binding domain-containing protein [Pelagibacteraceae bacterium]|nr:Arm DNA-binding domain-containing protein [Pelagibacteraceae bacterium]
MKKETQTKHKYTDAMIRKLPTKNNKYYVLDSECIGLRIYVQVRTGAKAFYLQRYLKEFGYSKKTKIGDFPEMSIVAARKLGGIIKADNVQGKDPIIAAAERAKEKTFGAIVAEYILKKLDSRTNKTRAAKNLAAEAMNISAWITGDSKDPDVRKVWRKYHDQLNINLFVSFNKINN